MKGARISICRTGRCRGGSRWCAAILLPLGVAFGPGAALASPEFAECFARAGTHYGIAPVLLEAIARTESRLDPLAVNTANADGSWDIGLMQINSRWLPQIEAVGMHASALYEPCTSIWVGAWVLAGNVSRYGYCWEAVGAYNAGTAATAAARARRERYADRVHRELRRAVGMRGTADAP